MLYQIINSCKLNALDYFDAYQAKLGISPRLKSFLKRKKICRRYGMAKTRIIGRGGGNVSADRPGIVPIYLLYFSGGVPIP